MTARPYATTPLFDSHICPSKRLFHRLHRTGRVAHNKLGASIKFARELASMTRSLLSRPTLRTLARALVFAVAMTIFFVILVAYTIGAAWRGGIAETTDLQLLTRYPDTLQMRKHLVWHAYRQVNRGVVIVDLNAADIARVDASLVGNRTNNIAGLHTVAVANFEAKAFHASRRWCTHT